MILTHPEHGNFSASYSSEVDALLKQGWTIKDAAIKVEQPAEIIDPVEVVKVPAKRTRKKRDGNSD
jgi:hypothetical protein